MRRADLIEINGSPYSAPMVVIPKPDGAMRVCMDFQRVNLNIVNDANPMHQNKDQLNSMGGAKVFTTLDLTK